MKCIIQICCFTKEFKPNLGKSNVIVYDGNVHAPPLLLQWLLLYHFIATKNIRFLVRYLIDG